MKSICMVRSPRIGAVSAAFFAVVTLIGGSQSLAQFGGPTASQVEREKAELLKGELEQRRANMQAMYKELQRRQAEAEAEIAEIEAAYLEAQRRWKEMEAKAAAAKKDQQVKVFALKYAPVDDAADAIAGVLNDGTLRSSRLRVAVDDRANRLIVSSTAETLEIVEALLQKLDQPAEESEPAEDPADLPQMMRVRVIWLTDGAAGEPDHATERLDERVLKSLEALGFASPRISCQMVTSLLVGKNRKNRFAISAPVELDGTVLGFHGDGHVVSVGKDRYQIYSDLSVSTGGMGGGGQPCEVQGAISTPLENYTILGTGVIVVYPSGVDDAKPKQIPCAFVLQLLPADDPAPNASESPDGAE